MTRPQQQNGFSLVEIIIAIVLLGIVGGLAAMIIGRTLDAYSAVGRREELQASMRLAIERMTREVRHALPNSICVRSGANCINGSADRFYFVPVASAGKYQDRAGVYYPGQFRSRLPVSPLSGNQFDVLTATVANPLTANTGDWVAVYNLNNSDIYAGTNNVRHAIVGISSKDVQNDANGSNDIQVIQLNAGSSFAYHSPARRFHVIDNNRQVTLFYLNGTDLYRDTTTFNNPNTISGNQHLLLQNVQACSFSYSPGSQQRGALLRIDLTVAEQGEQIRIIHDAHIYNIP